MSQQPVALFIAGSRSLASPRGHRTIANSELWAKPIIETLIRALPPGSVLVHGGAEGPDTWAHNLFLEHKVQGTIEVYLPDGHLTHVLCGGSAPVLTRGRWSHLNPGPVERNHHMVEVAMGYHRALKEPRVHVLIDPKSRTKGTSGAARWATKFNLPVVPHVWRESP